MMIYTAHAEEMMEVRSIAREWVEAVLAAPDFTQADPRDASLTRSFKATAAAGGRILRVVHRPEAGDVLVVTVHFDRGAQR